MDDFKPKYRKALLWGFAFFPIGLIILGPRIFADPLKDPMLTFSFFCIFVMIVFAMRALIKRIRFEIRWFTIEYYIGTTRRIMYEDVIDFGTLSLKFKGGNINLKNMLNSQEFLDAIGEKVDLDKLSGEVRKQEFNDLFTGLWSLIPIFTIPFVLYFIPMSTKWKPLVSLCLVLFLILIIGKIVEKRNGRFFEKEG